jgi:hypothetical protein
MTEETKLCTNVKVSIGLPSDVLVTLIVAYNDNLTIIVLL